jgi:hypothetical protein
MNMMTFEQIVLDEWLYIPLMLTVCLWAFGLGMLIGTVMIWTL